jgi:hypothetical protein
MFFPFNVEYLVRICKRLRVPGIDSEESTPPAYVAWRAGTNRVIVPAGQAENRYLGSIKGLQIRAQSCTGILEPFMGARNRVGKGLLYRPARLYRQAVSIPWNRFPGSLNVFKFGL